MVKSGDRTIPLILNNSFLNTIPEKIVEDYSKNSIYSIYINERFSSL